VLTVTPVQPWWGVTKRSCRSDEPGSKISFDSSWITWMEK
jgi:hypothetical protein